VTRRRTYRINGWPAVFIGFVPMVIGWYEIVRAVVERLA
jgi:hypothetical protein